ncbi:sensor histidine kinase [Portibacter lacus]|uniref:Signal transduction histidine kinase internal region domain-containing protein n=1 Tax=Portibacter lacus TaxID=1099794 RepID=A0AA37WEF2_9BACT|nr:histidine kinase [Portibacter lacus]GLR17217.1 hypothetical protein GCM10007940_18320 [Portibacter lacus]
MKINLAKKEVLFQVVLNLIIFVFYAFDNGSVGVEPYRYGYFLNYALAALIINYVALPRFYRNKNVYQFIGIIVFSLIFAVLIEELVLEQIYFPKRGLKFMGFYAFLDIIPIVTILSGFKFGYDALHKQREVEELKDYVRQSELQFLKSQINPHFLFNNLNNLYAYALEGSEKTPDIILELSGLLRYMLYECQDEFVSLRKEVDQLENFINLNELQIEDRGRVKFTKSDNLDQYMIAPLIMTVFVENAFKHSLSSLSENIDIEINLSVTDEGLLNFVCSNNYHEITNNDSLSNGIGLDNVKKRLALIYPDSHKLTIKNIDHKYTVALTIELSEKTNK